MPRPEKKPTNATEISVSELSSALKRALEDQFGFVRVRGEISGYRGPQPSGHVYFALKDASARLDAVIWKTTFLRLRFKPAEGLEVVASGKITSFAGKSTYQIIVEQLEPAGVGALMALLEARRAQLTAEGLFDAARKRSLPFLPRTIGIVTSPTGAVIRDILHRLADRFPVRVLVWPVRVQGETSAQEVAEAVAGFNDLEAAMGIPAPDVLIVARGGGSLEDLWSFNEEIVVRAVAASRIPVVSAIGHETDWTLIDQAADLRAPTPTAAAEIIVPVRSELATLVATLFLRLVNALIKRTQHSRQELRLAARGLPRSHEVTAAQNQRKDRAAELLNLTLRRILDGKSLKASALGRSLADRSPRVFSVRGRERTIALGHRLIRVRAEFLNPFRRNLDRGHDSLRRLEAKGLDASRQSFAGLQLRLSVAVGYAGRRRAERRSEVDRAWAKLRNVLADGLARRATNIANTAQIFASINYKAVLARGYALVHDDTGKPITNKAGAQSAGAVQIQFADGEVSAQVGRGAKRKQKAIEAAGQPSLF